MATFPIFLLVTEINKNYSQVDRVWSILPTVYHAHWAIWARMNGLPTQRVDNVLAFSVVWSLRLTYNYWRKGGYQVGSEDYRWEIIKKNIGGVPFFLLNVFFISTLQIVSFLTNSIGHIADGDFRKAHPPCRHYACICYAPYVSHPPGDDIRGCYLFALADGACGL